MRARCAPWCRASAAKTSMLRRSVVVHHEPLQAATNFMKLLLGELAYSTLGGRFLMVRQPAPGGCVNEARLFAASLACVCITASTTETRIDARICGAGRARHDETHDDDAACRRLTIATCKSNRLRQLPLTRQNSRQSRVEGTVISAGLRAAARTL
jgi:hypothetical protein